jgi:hypothetical protein
VNSELLYELAGVFRNEADAIRQPYAWPPRAPMTEDERREVMRLEATAASIAYRARRAAYEEGAL